MSVYKFWYCSFIVLPKPLYSDFSLHFFGAPLYKRGKEQGFLNKYQKDNSEKVLEKYFCKTFLKLNRRNNCEQNRAGESFVYFS